MQTAYTMSFESFSHLQGVFIIHLLTIILTLRKTYTFTIYKVNSRNQFNHHEKTL